MTAKPKRFRLAGRPSRKQAQREYDKQRGSARDRGYIPRWDRASKQFKDRNPLCLGCKAVGWVTRTDVTDHTVPHKGNAQLFWDQSNWQPLCQWHHDVIKQRLEALYRKGEIAVDQLAISSETAIRLTKTTPQSSVRLYI